MAGRPGACVPTFALTYSSLAVLCLLSARILRTDLGFRKCSLRAFPAPVALGLLAGGIGTGLVLSVGFSMPGCVRELSLPQIVLLTWLPASLVEELLTRGLLQGMLSEPRPQSAATGGLHWSVITSAAFFAAMHLPLLAANRRGVAILVASVFVLGLVAGRARRLTGSLWPAVAAHSSFNIGGTLVGVAAQLLLGATP